jgi:ABC-type lipoprotein export system ATPase subunit
MTTAKVPIISARGLARAFGSDERRVAAVRGVELDIYPGEFVAVVGRSGSGKTTLLNLLSGLDQPTEGTVLFQGRNLAEFSEGELSGLRRSGVSFVFQSFALLPLLSAYENVELSLHIGGVGRGERRRRSEEALALVGLTARAHHRPYELSGGEQQRVTIARALVTQPRVIFADEPTGELDSTTGLAIANLLREAVSQQGVTAIVATHDLQLAGFADRIVEMVDGAVASTRAQAQR